MPHSGKQLQDLIRHGHSFSGNERNCCFLNLGTDRFADVSVISGLNFSDDGRAIAQMDWNLDGQIDFLVVNRSGPQIRFFRNRTLRKPFLALRLRGTKSNRDAIGARVVLTFERPKSPQLVKTLRAGDGYLSQSSKWVHLGIGDRGRIQSLEVRWPSGSVQRFSNIDPEQRYEIVEGKTELRKWHPQRLAFDTNLMRTRKLPQSNGRIPLTSPIQIPLAKIIDADGRTQDLFDENRATLVILWASWCTNCLEELNRFADEYDLFERAGMRIVAVNVEIDNPKTTWNQQTQTQLDFATATPRLLDLLQSVNDNLFDLHRDIPLPYSFLINTKGQLAVIYKRPVTIQQILKDKQQLHLKGESRRETALPFPGRWSAPVRQIRPLTVALDFIENNLLDEAMAYASQNLPVIQSDPERHILWFNMGQAFTKREEHDRAIEYYRQAIQSKPDLAAAHFNLGVTFAKNQNLDLATTHFKKAVEAEPQNISNHISLARALMQTGRVRDAVVRLQAAIELHPKNGAANYELAIALALIGKSNDAFSSYRAAVHLEHDLYAASAALSRFESAVNQLAMALRSKGDEGEKLAMIILGQFEQLQSDITRIRQSSKAFK